MAGITPGSAAGSHLSKQLSYAQLSRQSASPHHHARTAAQVARSTPASSTVTITDPNNPTKLFGSKPSSATDRSNTQDGNSNLAASSSGGATLWTTLDMGGMGLKNLTATVCNYTFLTVLYINHNNLTWLTPAISQLTLLKTLDVSGNKLTSIPPEIGLLIHLRELLLFDNNLVTVPGELGTLYQLETLGLEGNPIQADLNNLLMKEGTQAVIVSLRENAPVGMPPPHRDWITIENDYPENETEKFTVLSYNILCRKYATPQIYGYTPSWALTWDYRKELILSEILGWNADIVCLQEVEMGQYEDIIGETLKHQGNYDGVFFPKSRAKTMSEKERRVVDGCATFYKADKFNLIEYHLLEYNHNALQRPDFKKSDDIYNRVMTKDNIAVMTILENKETLARVLVANSHIHWDPLFADVKLVQVGMLMDDMEKFASKHLKPCASTVVTTPSSSPPSSRQNKKGPVYASTADMPTIICGDFNSTPDSGVVEYLSKGAIKQDHNDFGNHVYGSYTTDGISHPLSLKSAYASLDEMPITNYTPGFKGMLDYIWYSSNTIDSLSLLGPVEQSYLNKVVGFPNAHFPSE
ncbi:Endonuclease/exonuclease/phosphatase [Absidia repens]|uniref:CCR4-Not complex 3'-5'-exoribonuclease subunit Ccr4 n=1 Tax=Absidia repens TaxID=90262 RepID=A0A1X2IQL1_9FUNG|nr:Endonuclease/exonuclease/phosphatase [Absidia repens]